ncbi:periodic tryptophan protein 2, partial [Quercus suber]|uniref:periodic tryptophan protein 2 n=1 Tax=Quercus suber TaxID=58331 RepID=UPI0032DF6760
CRKYDLIKSQTLTLPIQSSADISRLAVSPDGVFLITVDNNRRCLFINLRRHVILHRISFKSPVTALQFSPDGSRIAVAVGKLVQIWRSPGFRKEFFPFELVRTFADFDDKVTALNWSPDSNYLVAGSKDFTARLFSVNLIAKTKPFLFLGHRDTVVGAFFGIDKNTKRVDRVYTVTRDCYLFSWEWQDGKLDETEGVDMETDGKDGNLEENGGYLVGGKWRLLRKDCFNQAPAKLTACDYHAGLDMVVVGFSNGVFGLYRTVPDFVCIHLLSISREKITTAVFNEAGNWLTFGCAKLGQLLVWEWRSESYVVKQQGHYFDVNCVAYSPDSQLVATGADDNKVKVKMIQLYVCAYCMEMFMERNCGDHNNNVVHVGSICLMLGILFLLRNAFLLLNGEHFHVQIFVWSMKTGRLLDVLSGHEGPVHGLIFSPTNAILASSSWDRTVRLWDVFEGKGAVETFPHTHEVLTLVYRPDGRQLASSTLDGQIHFWDPIDGVLMYTIEGRRDIAGGRLMTDRRSAANSSSGKCFTTLCYSADGSYILAAGTSKYICMYDVADQVLLRRFQITHNLSLDGVLDFLNSKNMTEAGPMDLIDDDNSDTEEGVDKQSRAKLGYDLPGSLPNRGRPVIRTKCLRIAPTGRSFAAATTEGVLVYSIDESFIFDPTDLDIDVTPEAVDAALNEDQQSRALILSLRLNEDSLIKKCIFAISPVDIPAVASSIPYRYLQRLIEAFADLLESCPHLEFILRWCQELCKAHGNSIQQNSRNLLPALKSLQKAITRTHQDLADTCSSNEYMLRYLCSTSAKK